MKYFERTTKNIKKHYYQQDFGLETKVFLPHIFVITYVVFCADLDDSPGSPSTPTHNSNSLSFSSDIRDRDFIDDEICDQPGLIYDNVTANSSGNTIVADDICPSPRPLKPCKSDRFWKKKTLIGCGKFSPPLVLLISNDNKLKLFKKGLTLLMSKDPCDWQPEINCKYHCCSVPTHPLSNLSHRQKPRFQPVLPSTFYFYNVGIL